MTPTETAALLTKIAAIDNRRVTPEMSDTWAEVLDSNIRLQDAWWAAKQHFANRPGDYLTPGYLNAQVREVRRQRIRDMRAEPPPPDDLNPRQAIAWSKAYVTAVANGDPDPDQTACQQLQVTRREIGPDLGPGPLRALISNTTHTLTEGERP